MICQIHYPVSKLYTSMTIVHCTSLRKKHENIGPRINDELAIINTWLISNKLYRNINKTKYMIFNIKDKPPEITLAIGNSIQ